MKNHNTQLSILNSSRCPSHYEVRFHYSVFAISFSFYLLVENVEGTFAYLLATLFNGGEFRVGASGNVVVGEAADSYLVGYSLAHRFASIQYAGGGVVVDGKESVGWCIRL